MIPLLEPQGLVDEHDGDAVGRPLALDDENFVHAAVHAIRAWARTSSLKLAVAGGELRMTELAARALISRSGMTRRVARLVDEGIVRRATADADGRGVVVALTEAGVARLTGPAPVHLRGVSELLVARLDDRELAALKSAWTRSSSTARLAEEQGGSVVGSLTS